MDQKTRKLCITLSIILIAGISSTIVFVWQIKKTVGDMYKAQAAVKEQLALEQENANLGELLDEVGPQLDKLSTRVIDADGTVSFIDSLEALGKQTGAHVEISSVNVADAQEGNAHEYIVVFLTSEGTWQQVYTYLSMLDSLPYKVNIKTVSLQQSLTAAQAQIENTVPDPSSTSTTTEQKPVVVAKPTQTSKWLSTVALTVLKKKSPEEITDAKNKKL